MRQSRPSICRWQVLALVGFSALAMSCVATQVPAVIGGRNASVPGFWFGLWHGFIAPLAFVVSLFSDTVRVYAVPNAGRWYDFGFMLGIGGFSGGMFAGSRGASRRANAR